MKKNTISNIFITALAVMLGIGYICFIGYFAVFVEVIGGVIAVSGTGFGIAALVGLSEREYSER